MTKAVTNRMSSTAAEIGAQLKRRAELPLRIE
jgi:hypothetical protein